MNPEKKPCLISCGILGKEIRKLADQGEIDADLHFLSDALHYDYEKLKQGLKKAIESRLPEYRGRIVVVYGDVCLGFQDEMKDLLQSYGVVKVDALNCIDCLLGGKGALLDLDPDHRYFFLTPAFISFMERMDDETRKLVSGLAGIVLVDSLGNLNDYRDRIDQICASTGLPIVKRENVGLEGLKNRILEAMEKLDLFAT